MAAEVAEQPQMLARLLAEGAAAIGEAARRVRQFAPRTVMFAARGTSDHAALYGSYLVQTKLGVASGLSSPSTTTVYGARPDLEGVLFVAVSQSGGSPDLVESVRVARECGALTVAVTNAPESPLARAAELGVDVCAGEELAVAATKSYTAELLALYLLIVGAAGALDRESLAALPDAAAATLTTLGSADKAAATYRFADRIVVTARGYSYPTAREAALKLMEELSIGSSLLGRGPPARTAGDDRRERSRHRRGHSGSKRSGDGTRGRATSRARCRALARRAIGRSPGRHRRGRGGALADPRDPPAPAAGLADGTRPGLRPRPAEESAEGHPDALMPGTRVAFVS